MQIHTFNDSLVAKEFIAHYPVDVQKPVPLRALGKIISEQQGKHQ
jgi:hypothetical protein